MPGVSQVSKLKLNGANLRWESLALIRFPTTRVDIFSNKNISPLTSKYSMKYFHQQVLNIFSKTVKYFLPRNIEISPCDFLPSSVCQCLRAAKPQQERGAAPGSGNIKSQHWPVLLSVVIPDMYYVHYTLIIQSRA